MSGKSIFLVIAVFLFFWTGCSMFSSKEDCNKIIDKRTMVNVLTDIFLLEAQVANHQTPKELRDSVELYYAGVFEKYQITAGQFEKAYECYLLDDENMTWLMDEVLSSMSIIQSKLDEKKDEPK